MTKDEALKLALEAFDSMIGRKPERVEQAITAIKEALAQPEHDNIYGYASSLATAIWHKHYIKESPKFALLDTTEGVLTQIDNMTCGLVREKPAQPEQEPLAWISTGPASMIHWTADKPAYGDDWVPLYTTPPQRTWVGLSDEERDEICLGDESIARSIEAKLREKNGGNHGS